MSSAFIVAYSSAYWLVWGDEGGTMPLVFRSWVLEKKKTPYPAVAPAWPLFRHAPSIATIRDSGLDSSLRKPEDGYSTREYRSPSYRKFDRVGFFAQNLIRRFVGPEVWVLVAFLG